MSSKVITISMSNECIKEPPCPFCYQKDQKVEYDRYNFGLYDKIRSLVDEGKWKGSEVTFCFEYNGYNLTKVEDHWMYSFRCKGGRPGPRPHFTMTTMPEVITPNLAGYIKNRSPIEALALSYDSAKVPSLEFYLEKVEILHTLSFKVSCNFLLEEGFRFPGTELTSRIDQLNLLSLKPTGELSKNLLEKVEDYITLTNSVCPVAVDNCLAIQLGKDTKCHRGEDFIHILPDSTIADCCFKEKCFLYQA